MVRISILGVDRQEVDRYRNMVHVSYGSETKCHRCKFIGKTEKIAEAGEKTKQI
jgi:hypothetical protein